MPVSLVIDCSMTTVLALRAWSVADFLVIVDSLLAGHLPALGG